MTTGLAPCSSCARHVRRSELVCPFCGTALAFAFAAAPSVRVVTERLGRAAIFSLGAAAITNMAGCGARSTLPLPGPAPIAQHDSGTFFGAYGGPALVDGGGPHPHYGGPPVHDAGAPAAPDARAAADAGIDADLGCCSADYGSPPSP